MSIVKDQNLAPAGRRKINWVRDFMPALGGIEARFEQEQPFAGLRVAVSVHLEAKTANLGYVLAKGGAEVRLTGSNPLSTQDDVAAGLADMGVETFGIHGAMGEEYENLLIETLKFKPHLIVDDGGDLIHLLGASAPTWASTSSAAARRPPPASCASRPGSGGHPALPHDGRQRRQGQALL